MLERLHATIAAVCPIHGVSGSQGSIRIDYDPSATAPQQTSAQAALAAFDWSQTAHDAWTQQQTLATVGRSNMIRLAVNRPTTSNALGDVVGMSFPNLKPNTHYAFSFAGAYTAVGATTGMSLAVNGPASPNLIRMIGCIAESATATRNGAAGAYDTPIAGTASGGATALPFWIEGNISTGANGGTLQLRFASETNGNTVTILAGSFGELKAVA